MDKNEEIKKPNKKVEKNYNNEKETKRLWQFAFLLCFVVLGLTLIIPLIATMVIYEMVFGTRCDKLRKNIEPDYYPDLQQEKSCFKSRRNNINGAFYYSKNVEKNNTVVVVSHGIGCCMNGYLNRINYFAQKGYYVYGFDMTGVSESEGRNINGLQQCAVDLQHAIEHVKATAKYADMPLVVYGHSWSGYGSALMLNRIAPDKIVALATLSGFNNSWDIIYMHASRYVGKMIILAKPFVTFYQFLKFGRYAYQSGISGINKYGKDVLVGHSDDDPTVTYDISIHAQREKCTNPNARFVLYEGRGHTLSRPIADEKQICDDCNGKILVLANNTNVNLFQYAVNMHYEWSDIEKIYSIDEEFMDGINDFFQEVLAREKTKSNADEKTKTA
ncbi:MAG: alpha/beta fold hydrolase [Clostridia bacterium]